MEWRILTCLGKNKAKTDTKWHFLWVLTWCLPGFVLLSTHLKAEQVTLNVTNAYAEIYELSHTPSVVVELTADSRIEYARLTSRCVGDVFTFKLEEEVIMSAKIVTPILSGEITLVNFPDMERAAHVAERLRAGASIKVNTSGR